MRSGKIIEGREITGSVHGQLITGRIEITQPPVGPYSVWWLPDGVAHPAAPMEIVTSVDQLDQTTVKAALDAAESLLLNRPPRTS